MTYPFDRGSNGLSVNHPSLSELNIQSETVRYLIFQKILFQLSHDADLDLFSAFLPADSQSRIFLFKFLHLLKCGHRILLVRKNQSIDKRRLYKRFTRS